MGSEEDAIFPLLDRRAPVLERVRGGEDKTDVASEIGKAIGESVKSDDDEQLEDAFDKLNDGVTSSLAEELGVSEDEIDESFVSEISSAIVGSKEQDVLTDDALKSLGIPSDSEEDEESGMFN